MNFTTVHSEMLIITLILALFASNSYSAEVNGTKKLAVASNELAYKLHGVLNEKGNMFCSPASIFVALGMVYQGARNKTSEEMRKTLYYDFVGLDDENLNRYFKQLLSLLTQSHEGYELDISNAVVSQIQYPVLPEYKEVIQEYYQAKFKEVDSDKQIEATEEINKWVSKKTKGKVPTLLDSLSPDVVLILLNSIYFKGIWERQFSPSITRDQKFYNNGTDAITVPMMSATFEVLYGEENSFKAIQLSYKGGNASMVLFLPKDKDGLNRMEKEYALGKLNDFTNGMKQSAVMISLPKFKLHYSVELQKHLQILGIKSAFSNEADFSGISDEGKLKVSKVVHKAAVEVNEEGSEASAVTEIEFVPFSLFRRTYTFRAEHPFLFLIKDDVTKMILFFGRVTSL